VAFLAVLTEFVIVHILVASIAVCIFQILETLPGNAIHYFHLVTLLAFQRFMFAEQGEMSLAMVKRFRILEIVKTMAFRAIGGHFTLMVIVMTGQAVFVQTQIRGLFLF